MLHLLSNEAVEFLNKIYGEYTMVNRGWRNRCPGQIGWSIPPQSDSDCRKLYIMVNHNELTWDFPTKSYIPSSDHDYNRVALYTLEEDNQGDELKGLVACGHYEDIHKIVEQLKSFG